MTVTLDPTQIPEGKRFMLWQLATLVEVEKTGSVGSGVVAKTDGTMLQAAGVRLNAPISPLVNGTTLSSHVVQFIMPEETSNIAGTPANTINNYPDDTLWITALYDRIALPTDETYTIWSTSRLLHEQTGVRLRGSENEHKASALMADMFRSFGYTDVVHHEPRFMNSSNVESGTGPAHGRLIFSDASGLGDMLGNANPASNWSVTGRFVDLGTWTTGVEDLTVPAGLTGDVIAAVRFFPVANATMLNTIKSTLETENPGLNITGFIWCRSGGTYANQSAAPGALNLGGLPNISMPLQNLNRVVRDSAYFEKMTWQAPTETTNVVVARKPASTDTPDLIIVFTAHIDTVMAATGASDNGSGVSVLMALANYFQDKDLGNIELWFSPNGSEEGNSMSGARFIVHRLMTPEQRAKAININLDMVGSPGWFTEQWGIAGAPVDAVTLDPDPQWRNNVNQGFPQSMNLPSFLVSERAGRDYVEWAPGINNVRFNQVGGVDGARFAEVGIDSLNVLLVSNFDDALEVDYHRGGDNFYDNLSYERMVMVYNLIKNGVLKAVDEQVSKRVDFTIDKDAGWIALNDADRFFRIYDRVEVTIGDEKVTFSKNDPIRGLQSIPADVSDPESITLVLAFGTGIADHADPVRNTSLGLAPAANRNARGLAGVQLPLNTLLTHLMPSARIAPIEKSLTVGAQQDTLTEGTAGNATFVVTTEFIENGTAIVLNNTNNVAGITMSQVTTTNNSTTITINTTTATPGGNHPLTLTIDGVTSDSFNLFVVPKFIGSNPNVLRNLLHDGDVLLATRGNLGIFEHHSPFVIPEDRTLTVTTTLNVQGNAVLIVEGTLIVNPGGRINNQGGLGGTIKIAEGGTLINYGHVENVTNSTVANYGTIVNNSRFEVRDRTFFHRYGVETGEIPLNIHRNAIVTVNSQS